MLKYFKVPLGVWVISFVVGLLNAPFLIARFGGPLLLMLLLIPALVFMGRSRGDVGVSESILRGIRENSGMFSLLVVYYLSMIIAALRSDDVSWGNSSFIFKSHLVNIVAIFLGMFFHRNPRYTYFSILFSMLLLSVYSLALAQYVTVTGGGNARFALSDIEGALGSSSTWLAFAMQTVLVLGVVLDVKGWRLKFLGGAVLCFLYRAIITCGFATPVGLFLGGHFIGGFTYLFHFRGRKVRHVVLKMAIPLFSILVAIYGTYRILNSDDDVLKDVKERFQSVLDSAQYKEAGYGTERMGLASISWETFKSAPFLGIGGIYPRPAIGVLGGHQAFMDYLAVFGIFGGGAYIVFTILCIVNAFRRYRVEQSWLALASFTVTAIYFLGGIMNPCWYGVPSTILMFYAQPFRPIRGRQNELLCEGRPRLRIGGAR